MLDGFVDVAVCRQPAKANSQKRLLRYRRSNHSGDARSRVGNYRRLAWNQRDREIFCSRTNCCAFLFPRRTHRCTLDSIHWFGSTSNSRFFCTNDPVVGRHRERFQFD
jgi:hypothetical protein